MKVDPKKLNFTCKMAKKKEKKQVSMKMANQNILQKEFESCPLESVKA